MINCTRRWAEKGEQGLKPLNILYSNQYDSVGLRNKTQNNGTPNSQSNQLDCQYFRTIANNRDKHNIKDK